MAADRLETDTAVKALAWRLRDWGVDDFNTKARLFIDELTKRGWQPHHDAQRRQPPRISDECPKHPGEWDQWCRPCASERKADVEDHGPADRPTPTTRTAEHVAKWRAVIREATKAKETSDE